MPLSTGSKIAVGLAALALCVTAGVVASRFFDRRARAHLVAGTDAQSCPEAVPLGPACAPCVAAHCCAEVTACYANADCIGLNDCWVSCGEERPAGVSRAECPAACEKKHPASTALFAAWDECTRKHCEKACPRGPDVEDEER